MLLPSAEAKYRPELDLALGRGGEITLARGSLLLGQLQVGEALGLVSLTRMKVVPCKHGLYECWVLWIGLSCVGHMAK